MAQTPPADPTPPATATTGTPPEAEADKAGGVISAATLESIQLPKPKKAPEKFIWSTPVPARDGTRLVNYTDGKDIWLTVNFADCNSPTAKSVADKPANQRGQYGFCYEKPVGKIKDFPSYGTDDMVRGVKAGHLVIAASIGTAAPQSYTTADVEEFLGSLDLAALAKL